MHALLPGSPAPDFQATKWDGTPFRSRDLRGRKLWLAFFRYASCPICNLRVREMIRRHEALQRQGLAIVAVFQSPRERIAEYVGRQRPPFPLLADPDEEIYRLYGLGASWPGFLHPGNLGPLLRGFARGFRAGPQDGTVARLPGDFLIDEHGRIRVAFHARKAADHLPFADVERFMAEAPASPAPPAY